MIKHLSAFKHVVEKFDDKSAHMLIAQYIAHRVFKKDGLIHKYLGHSTLKSLAPHKLQFLERYASRAARFSFSIITGNPATDFYEMLDVFSEATYLLFSPGISQTLQEQEVSVWFNLIMYNGHCYQSFGPIAPYRSFDADDIFFFATERMPQIETPLELFEDVEQNPIAYMMLLAGANYPASFHHKNRFVHTSAVYDLDSFDSPPQEAFCC